MNEELHTWYEKIRSGDVEYHRKLIADEMLWETFLPTQRMLYDDQFDAETSKIMLAISIRLMITLGINVVLEVRQNQREVHTNLTPYSEEYAFTNVPKIFALKPWPLLINQKTESDVHYAFLMYSMRILYYLGYSSIVKFVFNRVFGKINACEESDRINFRLALQFQKDVANLLREGAPEKLTRYAIAVIASEYEQVNKPELIVNGRVIGVCGCNLLPMIVGPFVTSYSCMIRWSDLSAHQSIGCDFQYMP